MRLVLVAGWPKGPQVSKPTMALKNMTPKKFSISNSESRQVLAVVGYVLLVFDELVANDFPGVPSGNSPVQTLAHEGRSVPREVYETTLDVGVDQLDTDAVAHVETVKPALEPAFRRRLEEPDPGSLRGCAGDDGVE